MITDNEKVKKELQKAGIIINDIYDLVNSNEPYPKAIPVLVSLLKDGVMQDNVKEGVIRALAVKEAFGIAGSILIEEYNRIPKEKMILRWIIGNTMEVVISENEFEDVLKIVQNKENGISRQMFVVALGKIKTMQSEIALINLLEDDEVVVNALEALGTMKSQKAKTRIIELLSHPKPLIRKQAQKILKKIN